MGGGFRREGAYVHPWLIHVDIWQKANRMLQSNYLPIKKKKRKGCVSHLSTSSLRRAYSSHSSHISASAREEATQIFWWLISPWHIIGAQQILTD